jgi:predicted nucleic acid-binding protein
MRSKIFLDTNILVYAVDFADLAKQAAARAVVKEIRSNGNGVISTQVMQEFFSVAVKRLKLAPLDAKRLTMTLNDFEVVSTKPELVEYAMDLTILHSLSFWDALTLAAAREAKCTKLFTEDTQGQGTLANIVIENPL